MKKQTKILFVQLGGDWSYIQMDLNLLKKQHIVRKFDFIVKPRIKGVITIFKMLYGVLWADMTFSWFADDHAHWAVRLSRLFGKKSIIVIGGYEVVNLPEIQYGALLNPKVAEKIKNTIEKADAIISVSEYSKTELLKFARPKRLRLIYNSVDSTKFTPEGAKENLVLTVGEIKQSNLARKGLECFVRAAAFLPDLEFLLIGAKVDNSQDFLKSIATPNVKFLNNVSNEELVKWYRKAKVYCQLSRHEAFGVSLAEAMLCECVPVVTSNGAIPELVAASGFYAPYSDAESTARAISQALGSSKGPEARMEIVNKFDPSKREKELVQLIDAIFAEA
jgi:glycosyltransferase involved in cell wall biosynthesis